MAKRDSYGTFMANEFMPMLELVLKKENRILKNRLKTSKYKKFYSNDRHGILSSAYSETVLQYTILKEMSSSFKIELEANAYRSSSQRLDLAIYRSATYKENNEPEIGIEIKQVSLNQDLKLSKASLKSFEKDFIKLKNSYCKAKFIMIAGKCPRRDKIDKKQIHKQLFEQLDGRLFKKYVPKYINGFDFFVNGKNNTRWTYFNLLWRMKE